MAISTNGVMLTRLTGALYNQQLAAATYAEVLAGNSTAAALNTWANAAVAADFGSKTNLQVATTLITNVGLSSVAGLADWVAAQLTAGGTANRGATIISLLNSYSNMDTTEAIYGASVATFNTKVDASQALSQTTGNAGGTYAAVSSVVVNTALTLTSATQTSTGTAGDDTFTAAAGTWGAGDVVNGAAGTDTLNATISGTGPTQSATSLVSIETLNLTASPNPATLDLTGVTGLTSVNNASSANGATLTVSGLGNMVNTTITGSQAATTLTYTTAAVASTTADTMTATLNNVSAGSSLSVSGVENLTIASTGATGVANTLSTLTDAALIKLTVTGDKALTIGGTAGGALLTTVDAAAATGAITLSTGTGPALTGVTVTGPSAATAGLFTVTTNSGKDTVTTGAGNSVIDTGSGNDTITTGAGTTTVTPGTGNDALTLGAGVDTVRFAETGAADSDVITGFGATDVMAFRLGQVTAAATTTTGATTLGAGTFGTLQTNATSPSLSNVNGVGTATAIAFQAIAPNATATTGTVLGTSNVIALNGAFTDGTAAGVISALGSSAVEGIATTPTGKFLLVTYSVGNIAQVWSYAGDTTVDTNITSAELSLVATLNGVAQNSLTAANFATYLGAGSTVLTQSNAGQTITVATPLNIITTTANANGAFLTAGSDTINVNIGMLPTNTATTAMGLTVLDGSTSDTDTLNATVLSATFAAGLLLSNIETVNLEETVGGNAFDAATVMPGTKNFGFTGTGTQATISNLPASSTITFGAGRTGTVTATQTTAGTFDVALNGSGVAATSATAAPTAPSLSLVGGTNSTITVTGTSFLQSLTGVTTPFGNTATGTNTITGTGNLTLLGTGTMFAAEVGSVSSTYTGSLTLRPSDNTAFDLSGTGADTGVFTGVKTIDLTAFSTNETITLAAANGAWPVTVTSNNTTGIGALTVSQAGSGTTDALTVTVTNAAAVITSIAASSLETLIVNLGGTVGTTALKSVGGITLATNAATQSVTVNSNAISTTLGTVTADSLNATGVAGTVTATLANGASGAVFTGPASTASFVTGSGMGDLITTGTANDAIYIGTGGGTTGSANLTGGLGNDTYSFSGATSNNAQITDTSGTDSLVLTGATANISGINGGVTLATMGIDRLVVAGGSTVTVAGGQITGTLPVNLVAGTTAVNFTLGTAGVLDLSSLVLTSGLSYLDSTGTATTGVAGVVTGALSTGTANADSITGTSGTDAITGGGGADVLVGGAGTNTYNFASAANLAAATVTGGAGTDIIAISADTITLIDTNFTATHTLLEQLTLGGGITATTLAAAATAAGIATVNTGVGATTITSTQAALTVNPLAIIAGTALTLSGSANYTVTQAGTAFDTLVATGSTGTIAATFGNDTGDAIAITAGNGNMTVTGGSAGDVITVTGLLTNGQTFTGSGSLFNITATGAGAQTITGGALADTITGGAGIDNLIGNEGNDVFIIVGTAQAVTGGLAIDLINGGAGTADELRLSTAVTIGAADVLSRITLVEKITSDANAGIISLTLTTANLALTAFTSVDLSGDTDATSSNVVDLANGGEVTTITAVTGGAGIETITLGAASAAATLIGGGGVDVFNLAATNNATVAYAAAADVATNNTINAFSVGTDKLAFGAALVTGSAAGALGAAQYAETDVASTAAGANDDGDVTAISTALNLLGTIATAKVFVIVDSDGGANTFTLAELDAGLTASNAVGAGFVLALLDGVGATAATLYYDPDFNATGTGAGTAGQLILVGTITTATANLAVAGIASTDFTFI